MVAFRYGAKFNVSKCRSILAYISDKKYDGLICTHPQLFHLVLICSKRIFRLQLLYIQSFGGVAQATLTRDRVQIRPARHS
jgi:hypothetical protein